MERMRSRSIRSSCSSSKCCCCCFGNSCCCCYGFEERSSRSLKASRDSLSAPNTCLSLQHHTPTGLAFEIYGGPYMQQERLMQQTTARKMQQTTATKMQQTTATKMQQQQQRKCSRNSNENAAATATAKRTSQLNLALPATGCYICTQIQVS